MEPDVVIIGAGIAGLACAVALCDRGLRPLVLEREDIAGGRARSWTDEATGDVVDIGPHILLSEYPNMLQLLGQLGTREHVVWQRDKFITLADPRRPVDVRLRRLPAPLHYLPSMLTMPQLSLRDLASGRRVIWRVLRLSPSDLRRLDGVDAETYLRRSGVSERFVDWFWRSSCMTIMNVPLQRCSAAALLQFIRFMIGKSGYFPGFAGIGLGDLFVPGAARAIESAGGRVALRTPVQAIEIADGAVRAVRLGDGSTISTGCCVAAVPPQDLVRLLPADLVQQRPFADAARIEPSPYICSYLWFDRKLTRERFWTRVWSPENLNYDSYDLSNIRAGWRDRPSVIASNIIYSGHAAHLSDSQIVEATLRELAEYLPQARRAALRHWRVHRIAMARPAPYVGSEQLRPRAATPIRGLQIGGDWIDTGLPASMEGAVRGGRLAAEAVLEGRGAAAAIALPPPASDAVARLLGRAR
ncbi:MAG TPA: hydroxysqualene dehydroxylase HpnE [Burkholderiaceae bacterium]|nr:hydroxysqualene dehydroxylase HpnE [Burkholderiaceae bacterium]